VAKDQWYTLPKGEYPAQFLKALAMASHVGAVDPAELAYWFNNNWTHKEMTVEMYNRVKAMRT
jgi:hypothetical protein